MMLWLIGTALAADHEVSFELGHLQNSDPAYDLFAGEGHNGMLTWGARASVAVHSRVAITSSWSHTQRGATVSTGDTSFVAAWSADFWGVGVRGDLEPLPFLLPYVSAQAVLARGLIRLDEDTSENEPLGQLSDASLAPGGLFAAGIELRIPKGSAPFTLAWHLEAGYGLVGTLHFTKVDEHMQPGGLHLRGGMGIRF